MAEEQNVDRINVLENIRKCLYIIQKVLFSSTFFFFFQFLIVSVNIAVMQGGLLLFCVP